MIRLARRAADADLAAGLGTASASRDVRRRLTKAPWHARSGAQADIAPAAYPRGRSPSALAIACPRGHDKDVEGRTSSGGCRRCANDSRRRRRTALSSAAVLERLEERAAAFWANVDRSAGFFGCWPWTGARFEKGYGQFSLGALTHIRGNRGAWVLTNGPIPDGLVVMHACDNPPCCNPAHLRLGTVAENNRDAWDRGRQRASRRIQIAP